MKYRVFASMAAVLCLASPLAGRAALADNQEVANRLVATFVEAQNTMNADLLDRIIATDYIQHNPHVKPGLSGVKALFETEFKALKAHHVPIHVIAEDVVVDGDRVVLRQLTKFEQKGKWFQERELDEWRIADGKFAEHWDNDDAPQPSSAP